MSGKSKSFGASMANTSRDATPPRSATPLTELVLASWRRGRQLCIALLRSPDVTLGLRRRRFARTLPIALPALEPAIRASTGLKPDQRHLISAELRVLLDRCPPSREVLRALAIVENALSEHGDMLFQKMPVSILKRACTQLDRLVVDWSPRGLAELRSRLACVVIERSSSDHVEPNLSVLSTFSADSRLGVADARISEFEVAQREWRESTPLLAPRAAIQLPLNR